MKKQLLFIATMFLTVTSATVAAGNVVTYGEDNSRIDFRFAEPIKFIERGIEFMIFPDGSFDFNTEIANNVTNTYYRTSTTTARRSNAVNVTFGAPGTVSRVHYSTPTPRGVLVTHDSQGKVRRIGNVYINYDREGRIKRAGTVYMNYLRGNGLLRQVGGLKVNYNRWGEIVHVTGVVNQYNTQCNVGLGQGGHNVYNTNYDYSNYNDTEDYYYYRKNGEVKKQKKNKALKRS